MKYTPTIGLEIHAELKTATKMFCSSKNDPDEAEPNRNICPICMGHPGTLPTINKEAVKHIIRVGTALGGTIADYSEFDRKNYFYPDIPKGYQISQYKYPLVSGGSLNGVALTRIHLEEDTASSLHVKEGGEEYSLVDFNRAGVPLMELVTEPVITSAEEAGAFARELQLLLRTLGVAEANMEKGEMRVEANISVSATETFGTKVEVKNLNSFRSVERAIAYELERQSELLENGGQVVQETRGWDEAKGVTFSQRQKENSDDYRYFPDPDLPKLHISEIEEFSPENILASLPELPSEKRIRLESEYGIKKEDIETYVQDSALAHFFESVANILKERGVDAKAFIAASNYITSDLLGLQKSGKIGETLPDAKSFAELIEMVDKAEISSRTAKDILVKIATENVSPRAFAKAENLLQKSDSEALEAIAKRIIEAHEKVAEEYRAGKESALQFLVGQAMRETRGSANPQLLQTTFKNLLS